MTSSLHESGNQKRDGAQPFHPSWNLRLFFVSGPEEHHPLRLYTTLILLQVQDTIIPETIVCPSEQLN